MRIFNRVRDLVSGKMPLAKRRNPKWAAVRAEHLKTHPICALCGGRGKLEVHHIIPVHIDPTLELVHKNLITLCESKNYGVNCHLFFGHFGNYRQRYNPSVRQSVVWWRKKVCIKN